MKIKLIALSAAVCLASNLALASNDNAKIKSIEKQLRTLKVQVGQIKNDQDKKAFQRQINNLQQEVDQLKANRGTMKQPRRHLMDYPYGPAVIASPYLGTRAAYDASDLITNTPDINEDLMLLKGRQQRAAYLAKTGQKAPEHPLLEISGYVEGQANTGNDYTGHSTNDIDLTGAEIKLLPEINQWAMGYLVISYDNNVLKRPYSLDRTNNSRLYLSRGFLTIGKLNASPFYGTIGQIYLPFGSYNSYMITDPFTKTIGRAKQRPILLGFSKNNFHTEVYGFKGDSYTGSGKTVNNWGANIFYKADIDKFGAALGAGYIQNIADSDGMQNTYVSSGFKGFGKNEQLFHQVPAADINADFSYGPFDLIGDYIGSLRSFDMRDLSFNNKGAKVSALQTELDYKLRVFDKPATLAAGYQQSWEALGLNIPEHAFLFTAGISLLKDTIEKLEYRHDINYKSHDSSNGVSPASVGNDHRSRDVVTFSMDYYF